MNKSNKSLFKGLIVALTIAAALLAGSCNTWMSDNDFMSKIESEVHDANANPISVYVRYSNSKMGTSEPSGLTTMKVDVAHDLNAVTSDEYGFVKWAAFSTASFSPSKQHSNLYFESDADYNAKFKPLELSSREVVFTDPKSPSTKVKIYSNRNDIFIVPVVAKRPTIDQTAPDDNQTNVVRNTSIRILFSKPIDERSLKDEFGNSNILVTSGTAVLTEASEDTSARDITDLFTMKLGKSKKMLTLTLKQPDPTNLVYLDRSSKIKVTIYEDVRDTYGYNLSDKSTFSFIVGDNKDSIAPYIDEFTAGIGEDYQSWYEYGHSLKSQDFVFKTYIDQATNNLSDYVNAAGGTEQALVLKQRVKDKLNIYVRAVDIAGEGANLNLTSTNTSENDVSSIEARACVYVDSYGNSKFVSKDVFGNAYTPNELDFIRQQHYMADPVSFIYSIGAKDSNCGITGPFNESTGTVFTYDLSGLADGLIKIDLWAVDMVGNRGDTEQYSDIAKYNNGYRSIFVVKDSTAPDPELAKPEIDINAIAAEYGWYNETTLAQIKVKAKNTNIKDKNNAYLQSDYKKLQWAFKLGNDTNWEPSPDDPAVGWAKIYNSSGQPEETPLTGATSDKDGTVDITMCLKDDLGNVSKAVLLSSINYDNTAPLIIGNKASWKKKVGGSYNTAAPVSKDAYLSNNHILCIPVNETMSGLRRIKVTVTDPNGQVVSQKNPDTNKLDYGITWWSNKTLTADPSSPYLTVGATNVVSTDQNIRILDVNDSDPLTAAIGYLYIDNLKIGNNTGNYTVKVELWDSSLNKTSVQTLISRDSQKPVINKIYIPLLRHAVAPGTAEDSDGWYIPRKYIRGNSGQTSATNTKPGYIPLYLFITEEHSGVMKIEFHNDASDETKKNNIELYSSSTSAHGQTIIHMIEHYGEPTKTDTIIPSTDYTLTSTTIEFNEDACPRADEEFVLFLENVGFDSATTELNKINVTVTDLSELDDSKNEISVSDATANTTTIEGVKSDSYMDVNTPPTYVLEDRGPGTDSVEAQPGYTNEDLINLKITFKDDNSGYNRIKIESGVKVTDTTKVMFGNAELPYHKNDDRDISFIDDSTGQYIAVRSKTILITDLKLDTTGNETKSVKMRTYDVTGWENEWDTKSIILDTTHPQWKTSGRGLYSAEDDRVNKNLVYPQSGKSNAADKTDYYGLKFPGSDDLYFYKNKADTYIRINPEVSDNHLEKIRWGTAGDADYFYYKTAGDYTVFAYDKAGNKSEEKTFHLIDVPALVTDDDSRKDIKIKLENDVEFVLPQGADLQKNTFLNGVRTLEGPRNSNTYNYYNGAQSSKIWVYNYVLKKYDELYKLKVPVHSYAAGDLHTLPIVEYGVSHQYTSFPSDAANCESDAFIPRAPNWHNYTPNSQSISDGHLSTYVDSNGDIIIVLYETNHNIPPISLWLKDAVGNTEFILMNPGLKDKLGTLTVCTTRPENDVGYHKRNQAVAYVFDDRVGVNDTYAGPGTQTYPEDTIVARRDITFYKANGSDIPYVQLTPISDTCRFDLSSYGEGDLDNDPWNYTMKSRIIVWHGTGTPSQAAFYNPAISGSSWVSYKEKFENGANSQFFLTNNFPVVDNAAHDTTEFELWYIIEDRVGNYQIKQLKNKNDDSVTDWLYDATAPKLDVKSAIKVNHIGDANYYSDSSSVKYAIEDKQSGIQNDGHTLYSYPESGFTGRVQLYPENGYADFRLDGVSPVDSNGNPVNNGTAGTVSIAGVKDWAENEATTVGLSNDGCENWVKLGTPNPTVKLTKEPYKINYQGGKQNTGNDSDLRTADASNLPIVSNTNPFVFKAKSAVVKVVVTLSDESTEAADLLGWIIKDSPLSDNERDSAFYAATSSEIKQSIVYTKKNNNKWDESSAWPEKTKYCYPVNKAGILGQVVTVTMALNQQPSIQGSLTYSPDSSYVSYIQTNPTEKINFIKSGAKVSFTSNIEVSKAKIVVCDTTDKYNEIATLETTLTASNNKSYEVSLLDFKYTEENGTVHNLSEYLDTPRYLMFMISTVSEDSAKIELKYPSTNGFNNWAYDETDPSFSFDSTATTGFVLKSSTYYFNSSNPVLAFSIKNGNDIKTTDIKGYEYRIGSDGAWSNVPSSAVTGPGSTDTDTTVTIALSKLSDSLTFTEGTPYDFYFRAVDKAGNKSHADSGGAKVTVQKDTTAPDYGNITHSLSSGTFVTSSDGKTITFNKNTNLSVITIGRDTLTETGVGLDDVYYKITSGDTTLVAETKLADNGNISLSSITAKKYKIVLTVKDLLGNERTLRTFYAHGTAPAPATEIDKIPYSGLPAVPQYNGANIKGLYESTIGTSAGVKTEGSSNNKVKIYTYNDDGTPKTTKEEINGYTIRQLGGSGGISTTTFKLPVSKASLPENDKTLYYAVTYNSIVPPSTWNTKSGLSQDYIEVTIDKDSITRRHSFLFIWYKDAVGNISVYNIGVKDSNNNCNNWWTTDTSIGSQIKDPYIWIDTPNGGIIGEKGSASYTVTASNTNMYEVTGTAPGENALGSTVSIKYQPSNVTQIKVTPALTFSAGINKLYYTVGDGTDQTTITNNTDNAITLPSEAKTYKLYALDNNGNTKHLLTYSFVPDGAGPEGSVAYSITGDANYYKKTESGKTVTIIYNGSIGKVTKFTLTPGTITDAGIGLGDTYLYYKIGANGQLQTLAASGGTDFTPGTNTETYYVIAKDKFGNESILRTIELVQDTTPPTAGTLADVLKGKDSNGWHDPTLNDHYYIDSTTQPGTDIITYNPTYVTHIALTPASFTDEGSDLADNYLYYKIDSAENYTQTTYENSTYTISLASLSKDVVHTITVAARDVAGNFTSTLKTFSVKPMATYVKPQGSINSGIFRGLSPALSGIQNTSPSTGRGYYWFDDTKVASGTTASMSALAAPATSTRTSKIVETPVISQVASEVINESSVNEIIENPVQVIKPVKSVKNVKPKTQVIEQKVTETEVEAAQITAAAPEVPELNEPELTATLPAKAAVWIVICAFLVCACAIVVMLKKKSVK